jgi:hypothetical protein
MLLGPSPAEQYDLERMLEASLEEHAL